MLQIHVLHNNCKEIYEGIFPQRKFVFPEGIFYNLINYLVEDLIEVSWLRNFDT